LYRLENSRVSLGSQQFRTSGTDHNIRPDFLLADCIRALCIRAANNSSNNSSLSVQRFACSDGFRISRLFFSSGVVAAIHFTGGMELAFSNQGYCLVSAPWLLATVSITELSVA